MGTDPEAGDEREPDNRSPSMPSSDRTETGGRSLAVSGRDRTTDVEAGDGEVGPIGIAPNRLAYLVAIPALGLVIVFRYFGLVARVPIWAYLAAIVGAVVLSVLVEPWHNAPQGSLRLNGCLAVHVLAVTTVIYLTGWGPALGMAYAFTAVQELQLWGSALWKPMMAWSLANIAVAQYLIWMGWIPSFLNRSQAEAIGALGAFVLAIVIRMAGATGQLKERAEHMLAHQARHDMLTGLPNRALFYDRTEEALERAVSRGSLTAVMLFDLDRFKEINDTMGHRCGDQVLTEVGPRVRTVLRSGDTLARLGGDEFCVLLPGVGSQADAVRVAERIIEVLEVPFEVDGSMLGIEASCGIAVAPGDGDTADVLLQRADVAMYVAKEAPASVVVYVDDLNRNTPERLALVGDLRNAVARNEFRLHFQPKASMRSGEIEGAEALIRWQHPELGLLSPGSFIPEAERTGLIEPITYWVLDEALGQCRRWMDAVEDDAAPHLSVAVNLSTRTLLDASLPEVVNEALGRWGVPANLLDLEITETIIMTDPTRARRVLYELADMGVTLSIDDFGTGYSSLAYLRDLPVDQLKIDQTFVLDMGRDSDDEVIVRAVVDLAGNLGLRTVAEGVEDQATWDQLTELGCDSGQGFHLARPMAADEFVAWLGLQRTVRPTPGVGLSYPPATTRAGLTRIVH